MPCPMRMGPAADDQGLRARRRLGLVLFFIGAVEVGRLRLELGGAGVHHLIDRADVPFVAQAAHLLLAHVGKAADNGVGESEPLGLPQQLAVKAGGQQAVLHVCNVLEGAGEPAVYSGAPGQVFRRCALSQSGQQRPEAFVAWAEPVRRGRAAFPQDVAAADFQRADGLLEGGLEGAVYGHHLAGGLHLRAERAVAGGELVKRPAGYLDDAVVQRRLKRRRGLLGDGVGDFVETLAGGYLGRYAGYGVAGGLAGERGTAADAGVDLDNVVGRSRRVPPLGRVSPTSELGSRAYWTLPPPSMPSARMMRRLAERSILVLFVGERLAWRHHDAVTGVDAHGVYVLHVANGDAVVGGVAHHLVLDLFPAHKRAFDEHLVDGTGGQGRY